MTADEAVPGKSPDPSPGQVAGAGPQQDDDDIGDVLSAIRKLVSEEAEAQARAAQAGPVRTAAAQPARGPALVLTPALAVGGADDRARGGGEGAADAAPDGTEAGLDDRGPTDLGPTDESYFEYNEGGGPVTAGAPVEDADAEAGRDDGDDVGAGDGAGDGVGDVDTEALRRLVREILRDELQGDLGTRLTRNIMNIVRAEVARALGEGAD
jgi:hypothetical protein